MGDVSGLDVIRRNLKRRREELGWNHDRLARELRDRLAFDWTRATVTLFEHGRRDLSVDEWLRLEAEFGRKELLQGDGNDVKLGRFEVSGKSDPHLKGKSEWDVFARDARKLEGGYRGRGDVAKIDMDLEAEKRAAKRMGLSPLAFTRLAHLKWGHSLTAERERQAAEQGIPAGNAGHRAHITHRLVADLEEFRKEKKNQ